jgi:hypothetical protein
MVNPHVFPSAVVGFREAARLHSLVAAVWLVSIVIFVPVQAVVQVTTGPARANLPAGGLGAGEDMVVFVEVMRPLVVPLAVTLGFGCLMFIAWWILGKGLAVWWRYARLALIALILQVIVMISFWIPLRADIEERLVLPLLVGASVLTVVATAFVWLAALRGGWLLGEPDRRSALAAWVRGLWAVLREPVRSVLPLFVWALPGLVLLVFPLLIDGPAPVFVMLVAWLGSGFCWVAFHMSYAPPKPAAKRPVSPLVPPGPFVTTRFPTLHDNR